jgi:hypothetical protein
MTQVEGLIAGLQILAKYGARSTCAEHDCVYVGPEVEQDALTPEDKALLDEIGGWHWSTDADSWAFFT